VTGPDVLTGPATGPRPAPGSGPGPHLAAAGRRDRRSILAAALLAIGVVLGIAGLFPGYLGGASLAQQSVQLVPHAIYLAVWTASALLILLGGARLRIGALMGTGMSIVSFGFFFADIGTVIAGGSSLMGAGLVLALIGWLACAAGSVTALRLRATSHLPSAGRPVRPRGRALESVLMLSLAALGAAIAFAPSWDSYTLRTPAGVLRTVTAGNAFSNPGAVIAGDVIVMVALVAIVVAAAAWRPVRNGAALLAGAVIPMAGQAISALILVGQGTSPAQFGIPPAQAAQAGLTITSGVTPAFWIYCAFVVALAALGAWMVLRPRAAERNAAAPPRPVGLDVIPPATSTFSSPR
jgi:hypothetical protein